MRLLSPFGNLSFDPLRYLQNGALCLCVQIGKVALDHADMFPVEPQGRGYIASVIRIPIPDRIGPGRIGRALNPAACRTIESASRSAVGQFVQIGVRA